MIYLSYVPILCKTLKNSSNPYLTSKYIIIPILLVAICFSLLRFVNINADFPSGINTSGDLYTDEGWYAASAVRHYLTGEWYRDGDINTAVMQPGGQILYRISFSLLGLSLFSARTTIVIFFLLLIVMVALLVRNYFGNIAAVLSALILATNYFAFVYSRLALRFLIALFFIFASMLIAENLNGKRGLLKVLIASLLLIYGILTSSTVVFAVPLFLFVVWKNGKNVKDRLLFVISAGITIMVFVGSYMLIMRNLFPTDIANDNSAVTGSFITSFPEWQINLLHKLYWCIKNLGIDFVGLTSLLTLFAVLVSKRFRTDPLVQMLIGYIVIYIMMLSITKYGPPRYYLMLIVPFAGLCAIACITLITWLSEKKVASIGIIPLLLVAFVSMRGSWQIISYISNPNYSFNQMAHGVRNIIQEREGKVKSVLLFGEIADSISLEIGTNAANCLLWTKNTVDVRLKRYHPNYLIVHTTNIDKVAASEGGTITELGSWDVFNNYYANGEKVRLYYVTWPGDVDY